MPKIAFPVTFEGISSRLLYFPRMVKSAGSLSLGFLGTGKYSGILISEKDKGDFLEVNSLDVSKGDIQKIGLIPYGGFVIRLSIN
jgi:hypothetical protein